MEMDIAYPFLSILWLSLIFWTYEQIEIRIWLTILRKASDCYANFIIYVGVTVIYIYR